MRASEGSKRTNRHRRSCERAHPRPVSASGIPVTLERDADGRIIVTSPVLPEVATFGENEEEALAQARRAIEEALAARMAHGDDVPLPSSRAEGLLVPLDLQTTLKLLLYYRMRSCQVTKAELARRLGWHGPQVDRLLNLNHRSRIDLLERAFAALGSRIVIGLSEAA